MASQGLDAFIVFNRPNSFYFSGFACSNSLIVIGEKDAVFLTDFRYLEKATADIKGLEVLRTAQNGTTELGEILRLFGAKRVGFEGSIPYSRFVQFKKACGRRALQEAEELISRMRSVKDPEEIALIQKSQKLNEAVYRTVLRQVQVGMKEIDIRQGIRAEMNARYVEEGFDTIVASGPNSSLPHAVPSARRLRAGEYLLIDMGVKSSFYHSDMTRTVVSSSATSRHEEVYFTVLQAQQQALASIKPGALCREIDAVAREVISQAGYGEYFGHGLGHGVGLEIHESPTLNPRSEQRLEEGMVVTVEPGIYLPGFGGVRIEDLVVVTSDGYKNLTSASKRFQTL